MLGTCCTRAGQTLPCDSEIFPWSAAEVKGRDGAHRSDMGTVADCLGALVETYTSICSNSGWPASPKREESSHTQGGMESPAIHPLSLSR